MVSASLAGEFEARGFSRPCTIPGGNDSMLSWSPPRFPSCSRAGAPTPTILTLAPAARAYARVDDTTAQFTYLDPPLVESRGVFAGHRDSSLDTPGNWWRLEVTKALSIYDLILPRCSENKGPSASASHTTALTLATGSPRLSQLAAPFSRD